MSKHIAAEIWIGGRIPRRLVNPLSKVIGEQGVSLEWGDAPFAPGNAAELSAGFRDEGGTLLLHLYDDQARWGEFSELEAFLVQQRIAFRRRSEAKYEYDAELVEFRPGVGPIRYPTNGLGKPFVPLEDLMAIAAALDRAVESAGGRTAKQLLNQLRRARRLVKKSLPTVVPALERFEIVGGKTTQETEHV